MSMYTSTVHIHPYVFFSKPLCKNNNTNSSYPLALQKVKNFDFSNQGHGVESFRSPYHHSKDLKFRSFQTKVKAAATQEKEEHQNTEEEEAYGIPWPQRRAAITAIQITQDLAATLDRKKFAYTRSKLGSTSLWKIEEMGRGLSGIVCMDKVLLLTARAIVLIPKFSTCRPSMWTEWQVYLLGSLPTVVCLKPILCPPSYHTQLFDWMQKHDNISAASYTSFITLMGKGRLPKNALEMYCNLKDENIKSNVFICNAMLKCLISNGRVESAFKLFKQMQEGGLIPDIVTYSTLLAGCVKARHGYSKAHELLIEFKRKGFKLDSVMYGSLLALCASHGHDEEAEVYFHQMKNEGLSANEFHYSSLLNAYATKGKYEKAERLVDDMKSGGLVPNKVVLNSLLKVYAKSGHFEKAKEVLSELDAIGHALNEMPYCTIMDGLAKAGELQEAQKIFDEMKAKGIKSNGYSYSTMISAYSKIGKTEEVRELAEELENIKVKYDLVMMNTLLNAYSRGRDMERVMQTLKKMDDLKISPDWNTFSTLISYFCKEKLYDLALRTLEDMHVRGHQPSEDLYLLLITGLGESGQTEEAFKVYNQIKHNRRPLSDTLHECMFNILVSGKMLKEAYTIMKYNVKSISETCLKKFIMDFAEMGNIYIVTDVFREFHNSGYRIEERIFKLALSRYIEQGKKRELIQLLKWMKNEEYEVPPLTLKSVLTALEEFGQSDIAAIISLSSKHTMPS